MTLPVVEKGYANKSALWWPSLDGEETPELLWPRSVEVYDRMRRQDAQVMSVLRAVTLPIRRTTWRVDGSGAKKKVAKFVADELGLPLAGEAPKPLPRTKDRFSWSEHLRLALLMLPFGHSFFEQVYRVDGGVAHLRKLGWRPPKTIESVKVADDGGLIGIKQHGMPFDSLIGVERLVAYVNDREGGNWLGQSLLRPAYKFWLLKDRALRTQAQTIERNGLGVPLYIGAPYSDAISGDVLQSMREEELQIGAELAQAWRGGDNAGAAIPNGANLILRGVEGDLPDAEPVVRYYDEQIARAVLAHFLNLGTETGSWALGSTFADFFTLSLQTVADQIADVATQHVVEDLVDVNFGTSEPAPRIVFDEIGSRHPATAEAIKALVDSGALSPDDPLEQFVRTTYGLPAADPDSRREKPAPTIPQQTGDAGGNTADPAPEPGE